MLTGSGAWSLVLVVMPNGKGTLDCSYCVHRRGWDWNPHKFHAEFICGFHGVRVPPPKDETNNRICCHFEPSEEYVKDNPSQFFTVNRRFGWFGCNLEPGVLYEFGYNEPSKIQKSAVLRVPDYEHDTWRVPQTVGHNPLLLATPVLAQLSFLSHRAGAPEPDRLT